MGRQKENKQVCPECKKEIIATPARDYTKLCSDCFGKAFVNSIFKK